MTTIPTPREVLTASNLHHDGWTAEEAADLALATLRDAGYVVVPRSVIQEVSRIGSVGEDDEWHAVDLHGDLYRLVEGYPEVFSAEVGRAN